VSHWRPAFPFLLNSLLLVTKATVCGHYVSMSVLSDFLRESNHTTPNEFMPTAETGRPSLEGGVIPRNTTAE
jgi:hypothetical protein